MEVLQWWELVVKQGNQPGAERGAQYAHVTAVLSCKKAPVWRQVSTRRAEGGSKPDPGEKLIIKTRTDEISVSESARLYHHELHKKQKQIKKTSILQLQTVAGLIEGHLACADYLEKQVEELLLQPHPVDLAARNTLLAEVQDKVFTELDNKKLLALPTAKKVKEVVSDSSLLAAPGTDGIPSLLCSECWDTMGTPLTDVVQAIHRGGTPTKSMRTSMMVFGAKPKKPNSIKPGDKRRISLLNADFKVVTGIEAKRFGKTDTLPLPITVSCWRGQEDTLRYQHSQGCHPNCR